MFSKIKYVAFDADDTLWENENRFQSIERRFQELLSAYGPSEEISRELFRTEMERLDAYGYGTKGFMLSMVETAIRVSNHTIEASAIDRIIGMGQELLSAPVALLPDVGEVLEQLSSDYRLIVATKGDLQEQERKLAKSGLLPYFHHIEIMSEKNPAGYRKLLAHLKIRPDELVMVGNSLKSDILPILELGGYAIHIPYHVTWQHEVHQEAIRHERLLEVDQIKAILPFLK